MGGHLRGLPEGGNKLSLKVSKQVLDDVLVSPMGQDLSDPQILLRPGWERERQ